MKQMKYMKWNNKWKINDIHEIYEIHEIHETIIIHENTSDGIQATFSWNTMWITTINSYWYIF